MNASEDVRFGGPTRIALLWLAGCVVGMIAYGALFQSSLDRRTASLARERPRLEKRLRELRITVIKYEEFSRDRAALETKNGIVGRMLPSALSRDDIRHSLERCAARTHVEILSVDVTAGGEAAKHGAIAVPLTVAVRGPLGGILEFFTRLDRVVPQMQMRNVVIERVGAAYRGRGAIATFVYDPPRPRPRPGRI